MKKFKPFINENQGGASMSDVKSFEDVSKIEDELERINVMYEFFNEDTRLSSKSARVEFLTTVHIINRYLKPGSKIMDIGAGAGEYSLHFAREGYDVTAVELTDANIRAFEAKLTPELNIDLHQGNACDLSKFRDGEFDIVLVFGPLYHLSQEEDQQKCIREAKRVCKDDGVILFAFLSNDMVILTANFIENPDYFKSDLYDHETFKLKDGVFIFFTVDKARKMLLDEGIEIFTEVAQDGLSELLAGQINEMDDESYEQYLKYHLYACEKPELLGHSNHILFVGKK